MDNITLEWEQVNNINSIRELDDTYFYAFTQNNLILQNKLLYIGIAYHQDVADEIRSTIRRFEYNISKIKIWLGYIHKSDYKKTKKKLVLDIESLLICGNEPLDNTQCVENYNGRDLKIKNRGCGKIKNVKCEYDEVIVIRRLL